MIFVIRVIPNTTILGTRRDPKSKNTQDLQSDLFQVSKWPFAGLSVTSSWDLKFGHFEGPPCLYIPFQILMINWQRWQHPEYFSFVHISVSGETNWIGIWVSEKKQ